MRQRKNDPLPIKGYFTFAQNSAIINYLEIAYLQALSIKCTQGITNYAVAVDAETKKLITDKHRKVFDYIIDIPDSDNEPFENEWLAWYLTPFRETVKLDSDILFTRNIDHWWPIMQQTDVCCTNQIRDYEGNISSDVTFRKLYKKNKLPTIYSGFTYFRISRLSQMFFEHVHMVFTNWEWFRDEFLIDCRHEKCETDEAYSLAVNHVLEQRCYRPKLDIPTFTHMKGPVQGWPDVDWTEHVYAQVDDDANLTVGFNRQMYPFHYVNKSFASEELIGRYERILESR